MPMTSRREILAAATMGALLRRHAGAQQGAPAIMYRDYSRCSKMTFESGASKSDALVRAGFA
jgi:hypothetical protein